MELKLTLRDGWMCLEARWEAKLPRLCQFHVAPPASEEPLRRALKAKLRDRMRGPADWGVENESDPA